MASWLFRNIEEWLSGGDEANRAIGTFDLNGTGELTGFPTGVATGVMAMLGTALATTEILGVGVGTFELDGSAVGFQARFIGRLQDCGHPVYAIEDWENDE